MFASQVLDAKVGHRLPAATSESDKIRYLINSQVKGQYLSINMGNQNHHGRPGET